MTAPQSLREALEVVAKAAQAFCSELQEDADGVPQSELAELHDALDKWEDTVALSAPEAPGEQDEDTFQQGMVHMEGLLAKLLKVTDYEGGDGSEDRDQDATLSLINILAAAGLWDKDENKLVAPTDTSAAKALPIQAEIEEMVRYLNEQAWIRDDPNHFDKAASMLEALGKAVAPNCKLPSSFSDLYMTESEAPPIERNPPWPGPLPETPSAREHQLETALREARAWVTGPFTRELRERIDALLAGRQA